MFPEARIEIEVSVGLGPHRRLQGRVLPAPSGFWGPRRSWACGCITPVSAFVFARPLPNSPKDAAVTALAYTLVASSELDDICKDPIPKC